MLLFAAIAGVLVLWWLRAPETSGTWQALQADRQTSAPTSLIALVPQELPSATPTPPPARPTETPRPTSTPASEPIRHKVQPGETVSGIAQRYGASIGDIIQANGLPADGRISVGQELLVPVSGPSGGLGPTATPQGGALMYVVQSGDTISDIAQRYKSRIDWILEANKLKATDYLRVGQALLVPLSAPESTPSPTIAVTPETPTPTPIPTLSAPALLSPPDGAVLTNQLEVVLTWLSVGTLGADEFYVVTVRAADSNQPAVTWWTKSTTWRLPAEYRGTARAGLDFTWHVQVRSGSPGQPGPATSPVSAERRFTWR